MRVAIREAEQTDADGIASVHVRAWQAAYVGMMPDDYLDALTVAHRAEYWRSALAGPPRPQSATLIAVDDDETVVGFASIGPASAGDADASGELYALNVDPSAWGTGAAATLLESATQVLAETGFSEAVLWVHPDNDRARRFYERWGWGSDELHRVETVLGVDVPEIRYSRRLPSPWRDGGR